jgi:hypothetical protein
VIIADGRRRLDAVAGVQIRHFARRHLELLGSVDLVVVYWRVGTPAIGPYFVPRFSAPTSTCCKWGTKWSERVALLGLSARPLPAITHQALPTADGCVYVSEFSFIRRTVPSPIFVTTLLADKHSLANVSSLGEASRLPRHLSWPESGLLIARQHCARRAWRLVDW